MKAAILLTLLLATHVAWARLPVPVADADRWSVQGSGEARWFGFFLYTAKLWRSGDRWQSTAPYALELTYQRQISSDRLVSTSIDEITRLGEKDEKRLQEWRGTLASILPSVKEGDVIVGLHQPGQGARFFYNGKLVGNIADAQLAEAFFSIWLDARARFPELRNQLLTGAADQR